MYMPKCEPRKPDREPSRTEYPQSEWCDTFHITLRSEIIFEDKVERAPQLSRG